MTALPGSPFTMRKVFFLPMLAAGLLFFFFSCNSPNPASIEYEEIDTMQDPLSKGISRSRAGFPGCGKEV
jgi:hypothetical protein